MEPDTEHTAQSTAPWVVADEPLFQDSADAVRRLLHAGLEVFAERGFHAATTREIAARANMSPAALYIHFRAKTDLLYTLSRVGHLHVLRQLQQTAASTDDPVERIRRLVETFTAFHVRNHRVARVAQYEHRALSGEQYESILQLRRDIDAVLREAVTEGVRTGAVYTDDLRGTLVAIASLCIDVVRWYEGGPHWSPDRLATLNSRLVLTMLRARGTEDRPMSPPRPRSAAGAGEDGA